MKIMAWFECLVEIVRAQARKCTGVDTFLFANQAVPLKYSQTSLLVLKIIRPTDEEKSITLVKHEEPKSLAMQKMAIVRLCWGHMTYLM